MYFNLLRKLIPLKLCPNLEPKEIDLKFKLIEEMRDTYGQHRF